MTPPDYTIRPFREEDLPRLIEITSEAFNGVSMDQNIEQRFGPIADQAWQWRKGQAIRFDAERDSEGIFVAERQGEIIGYITTWIDESTRTGNIPNLAVSAGNRGHGIGRALIEFALQYFRDKKLRLARIETLTQNGVGQKLYPSLGFHEVARQIHYGMLLDDGDAT
jgi:ribosomal protein S18 acetylase RimI-like enzyme